MAQRGFNVGVFKAAIASKKFLRPNLYNVEFNIPNVLVNGINYAENKNTVRTLEYFVEATSMPGITVNTYQAQRYGYGTVEQRPLLPTYTDIMFTVIFDEENLNYDFFYDWMNSIVNVDVRSGLNEPSNIVTTGGVFNSIIPTVPYELAYKEDYVSDIGVQVYNDLGQLKKKIILRDAFPKAIGDIRLAWSDNNSYMRLPIMFGYTDWYSEILTEELPTLK